MIDPLLEYTGCFDIQCCGGDAIWGFDFDCPNCRPNSNSIEVFHNGVDISDAPDIYSHNHTYNGVVKVVCSCGAVYEAQADDVDIDDLEFERGIEV